jgi:hypothetical protein
MTRQRRISIVASDAADDCLAQPNVAELTIELAT